MTQQIDPQDFRDLRKEVNQISKEVAKGDKAHENLKEMLGDHIEKDDKWKEKMSAQVDAIAQALLQDQTRDTVEKAVDEKTEQKAEKDEDASSDKRLLWQTTIVLSVFSVITNLDKIFGFLAKIFSFLAG